MGNGEEVFVDYVGTKSKNPPGDKVEVPKAINPKKLYVANFNALVTKEVIQKAFKGCSTVDMPYGKKNIRSKRRFCFVYYEDESSAKQAFENAASINLGGKVPYVTYAKDKVPNKRKKKQPASAPPTKKQKVEA